MVHMVDQIWRYSNLLTVFLKIKNNLYNKGNHINFTYIDDIVNPIYLLLSKKPKGIVPHEIYNLASSKPIN